MAKFLLWCILLVICWPLALLALLLYPLVWILLLPFRLVGIAVGGVLGLLARDLHASRESAQRTARALAQRRHFTGARRFSSSNQFSTTRNSVMGADPSSDAGTTLMNRPSGRTS